jgi:dTDP-glucose 4,6-dehydratase
MNLLVTGGAGFIGSCFVEMQINAGNKVLNLDAITYAANLENNKSVVSSPNYKFVKGSITDRELVYNLLKENNIDAVVNFAAESHVDNSINSPGEFIDTNILGVFNMLEAARKYYTETAKSNFRFIQVSTDEVYGSLGDEGKFSEASNYEPNSPYSASKAAGDHLARAWFKTYKLPAIITNCSNNYGPRQHKEKLIPTVIRSCLEGKNIPVYGTGKNVRDWIFVEDHCRGIALALEKGVVGEKYCFGGGEEKTNIDIVTIICEVLDEIRPKKDGGSYKAQISFVADRAGHDWRYAIDDSKARKALGYNAQNNFKVNIRKTIEWYLVTGN